MITAFLSYRRHDGALYARSIYEYFKRTYKNIDLFYDIHSMDVGIFAEQIYREIEKRDYFIVLLTPTMFNDVSNTTDWVCKEITFALEKKKIIIPLLIENFEWPAKLPEGIIEIASYEAVRVRNELFPACMEKLSRMMIKNKKYKGKCKKVVAITSIVLVFLIVMGGICFQKIGLDNKQDVQTIGQMANNECQVEMQAILNGQVMRYAYEYNVSAGDVIEVNAKSSEADIAFISYYFIQPDKMTTEEQTEAYEKRNKVYSDSIKIKVPHEITGTSSFVWIEAVASNDDGSDNRITKTGWQGYYLYYID